MHLFDRLSGLTGLLAVALYVTAVSVAAAPLDLNPTTDSSAIADELAARTSQAHVGAWLLLTAALLTLVFGARLHGSLRRRTTPGDWVPALALVASAGAAGSMLLDAGIQFALGEAAGYENNPDVARTFFLYGWNSSYTYAPSLVCLVVAGTLVAFRARTFPRWFRWFSVLVLALTALVLVIGPSAGGLSVPSLAWVAVASLVIALGRAEYAEHAERVEHAEYAEYPAR